MSVRGHKQTSDHNRLVAIASFRGHQIDDQFKFGWLGYTKTRSAGGAKCSFPLQSAGRVFIRF